MGKHLHMTGRVVLYCAVLLALAGTLFSVAPAFAASNMSDQSGNHQIVFVASHKPLCSRHGCDGLDPYRSLCAGQSWDSWGIVFSVPIQNSSGHTVGYTQLWFSRTCKTNWARTVSYVSDTNVEATVMTKGGNLSTGACDTSCANMTSYQLYLPTTEACAWGQIETDSGSFAAVASQYNHPIGMC